MSSYAIVGASRGIGFGYVEKLSSNPQNVVFALVRNPDGAEALQKLASTNKNIHVVKLDLDNNESIKLAAESVSQISRGSLDVLINNAAVQATANVMTKVTEFSDMESFENELVSMFRTNVVGISNVANAFIPLLRKGQKKQLLFMSSSLGSPQFTLHMQNPTLVAYSISKAALTMVATKFAVALKEEGITVVIMSPGVVKTMQGPVEEADKFYTNFVAHIRSISPEFRGVLEVDETVTEQLALLDRVTIEDTGKFVHSSGQDANLVETAPSL